jgi:hypothetical protein
MTTKILTALMFRDVIPGKLWDVRGVEAHRVQAHLDGGWHTLLTAAEMRAADIADTYNADLARFGLRERL